MILAVEAQFAGPSFATRKRVEGVPVQLVQYYLGHRSIQMTPRHTHLVPEHLWVVVAEDGLKRDRMSS